MTAGPYAPGYGDAAIALIELSSIARAFRVGDEMVKRAPCRVLEAGPISPGRYLILVSGPVAVVEESFAAGLEAAGEHLHDRLLLPGVHGQVLPALDGTPPGAAIDSLGAVETASVASCIVAADVACKCTPVTLLEVRLGAGIGGKGVFTLTGALADVEAAVEAAATSAREKGRLVHTEVIARPHTDFRGRVRGDG